MIIVGAGMAGLLAARMLSHRDPVVIEARPTLPNNHSAVLRFRTPTIGEVLGIEFRKVSVIRTVVPWRNPAADAMAYAAKNLGTYSTDRSVTLRSSEPVERWIAPPDLIERMAERVDIRLGAPFYFPDGHEKVISTIPMSDLMDLLDYPAKKPEFAYRDGVNIRVPVRHCDAFATVMIPNPGILFSRVSVTGNEMIIELPGRTIDEIDCENIVLEASRYLGISVKDLGPFSVHNQHYAKILPIDEQERRTFIFWASSMQNRAFSLGRFACWRPGLLMDDVVSDIRKIDSWMSSSTPGYAMDLHHAR